jgi:hypothetical protein
LNSIDNTGRFSVVLDFLKKHGGIKILLIALVGVILLTLSLTGGSETEQIGRDETETRLEELCSSIAGVGRCRVMVTYEKNTSRYGGGEALRVESVAVACKGADSVAVRSELTKLFTSLFGIGANRVSISKMK